MRKVLMLAIALLVMSFAGTAVAGGLGLDKPIELRFAYGEPDSWPGQQNYTPFPEEAMAKYFKAYVESHSNGMITVKLLGNSIMGSNKQVVEMVRAGSLDLCTSTGSMGSMFPKFDVIYMPYVFRSEEVAWNFLDHSGFWKDLMAELEQKTGMVVLGVGQNGVRNFTNNEHPIKTPADLKGLKIRVMESPVYIKMIEALGGQATPIGYNELYTALQTRVVDGEENPISIICAGKFYEVQKYLTLDGHTWSEDILTMNAKRLHDLPAEAQQLIRIAGYRAGLAGRMAEEFNTQMLKMKFIQDKMEVYTPSGEELARFREVARPPVEAWLRKQVGDDTVDAFLKAVADSEKELGYTN